MYSAPNINRLAAKGVSADLIPSYPSKTFPNHYTIVTGLYPGHHGIVANTIKDPPTGRRLSMSNSIENGDAMWWGGEPIWVTVQRAGMLSAAMFWPGSEAPIEGHRPNFWAPFNSELPGTKRVDQVLSWLDLPPGRRPTFLTLYFSEVDAAGHNYGPNSSAVRTAVRRADGHLGRLLRGLERRHLTDKVNIVIVADHGMAETSTNRVVVLDDYISRGRCGDHRHQPDAGTVSASRARGGRLQGPGQRPSATEDLPQSGDTGALALPRSSADPADCRRRR